MPRTPEPPRSLGSDGGVVDAIAPVYQISFPTYWYWYFFFFFFLLYHSYHYWYSTSS